METRCVSPQLVVRYAPLIRKKLWCYVENGWAYPFSPPVFWTRTGDHGYAKALEAWKELK